MILTGDVPEITSAVVRFVPTILASSNVSFRKVRSSDLLPVRLFLSLKTPPVISPPRPSEMASPS